MKIVFSDGRDCVDDALFPCFLECKGPSQFQCMSTKRSRKQTVENSYSVGLEKRGPARHPAFLSCFHICCMCVNVCICVEMGLSVQSVSNCPHYQTVRLLVINAETGPESSLC